MLRYKYAISDITRYYPPHSGASLPINMTEPKLQIRGVSSDTSKTFVFESEDHTLGNALRYVLMRDPNVEFCGYSVPHPQETKMNLRIQTKKGDANDALRRALNTLIEVCEHVDTVFDESVPPVPEEHADVAGAGAGAR